MNPPSIPEPGSTPPPSQQNARWALAAVGGVAALVLIIGLAVWVGGSDDTSAPSSTAPESTVGDTSTTTSSTSTSTTTTSTSTSTTTTTTTTTVPPTTTLPAFSLPAPDDTSWTVDIFHVPDAAPLTMNLATIEGDLRAYDGQVGQWRCIGVVGVGDEYSGWCGPPDDAGRFVILRGIVPWLVEVGATVGDVQLLDQDSGWRLPSNGCREPITAIIAAADLGPLPATGLVCADGEAFVGIGTLLFGEQRAPDGGGLLVANGDEGWDIIGGPGTSIDCAGWSDGIDRCALFGVEAELFEALLPVPPSELQTTAVDIVDVRDETATALTWIGEETDPAAIDAIIVDQLVDPGAEVPATVMRAEDVGFGTGAVNVLVIEVPEMDDSIASTTWAVWISSREGETAASDVRMFAWETCARGLAGVDLCI
jgi:hypothetical protein